MLTRGEWQRRHAVDVGKPDLAPVTVAVRVGSKHSEGNSTAIRANRWLGDSDEVIKVSGQHPPTLDPGRPPFQSQCRPRVHRSPQPRPRAFGPNYGAWK
jgi:hypothetical protein